MVRNTPISAFSDARDLLAYDVYSPTASCTSLGSESGVHLADVDAEDSVLNRRAFRLWSSSASDNDDSDTDQEKEGSKANPASMVWVRSWAAVPPRRRAR